MSVAAAINIQPSNAGISVIINDRFLPNISIIYPDNKQPIGVPMDDILAKNLTLSGSLCLSFAVKLIFPSSNVGVCIFGSNAESTNDVFSTLFKSDVFLKISIANIISKN
ncbi:hypothetical protein V1478_000794 [Vespula squamosa]|uniref:Uncharacterized protein n=1 Tax=Vespula squamosa TaxID=30214 RepID=A0ABD2C6H7_VESSQ